MRHAVDDFQLGDRALRYSLFAPKLYNYCLSLGFQRGLMMPSRAFCSDETQGYPVILLMQHFGVFPFDHGRVGGKVATDRNGPHAAHGEDLVIVQASHVGYDPARDAFGVYQRERTAARGFGHNCGKLCEVLQWYQREYAFARGQVSLGSLDDRPALFVDNHLLAEDRHEGLFLRQEKLIDRGPGPLKNLATGKAFSPSAEFLAAAGPGAWTNERAPIGDLLTAERFTFKRGRVEGPEGKDLIEASLAAAMPTLVTSPRPALDAARYNTQVEFDRTYRSFLGNDIYKGKNLLFVAGLNIDVSVADAFPFPLTKFVPWAAYYQLRDGTAKLLEQDEILSALAAQSSDNSEQLSFDAAIAAMSGAPGIRLPA